MKFRVLSPSDEPVADFTTEAEAIVERDKLLGSRVVFVDEHAKDYEDPRKAKQSLR